MNIITKQITKNGSLQVQWLSEGIIHNEIFPAKEVQFYMYTSDRIDDAHEDQVLAKGEGWVDYTDFLQAQLSDDSFCEQILSTNTLLK